MNLIAYRMGFIEKCASCGVTNPDIIAFILATAELEKSASQPWGQPWGVTRMLSLPSRSGERILAKAKHPPKQTGFLDTPIVQIPQRYAGGGLGMAAGGLFGGLLANRMDMPWWLGSLLGAGGLGYLGQKFGQPYLAKYFPKWFSPAK